MSSTLSVMLVHSDERERTQIRQTLETVQAVQIVGERSDLRAGMALAHQLRPAILVMELNGQPEEVFHAATQFRLHHPDGVIFLSTDQMQPDLLMQAMRAGAQEVLRRPLDRGALTSAVDRVVALQARRTGQDSVRKVFSVFSSKGGIGTSTLAVNLASALRRLTDREVAIVDLEHQTGVVAAMLGVDSLRSVGDAFVNGRVDSASLQDAMARHRSGLAVLAQPERLDAVVPMSGKQAAGLVEMLAATYDYVVIDAPHDFNDLTREVFDRSSTILLVTDLSFASVRAARRALDVFASLNYLDVPDRVRIVINRRADKTPITPAQVEDTLGMPIAHSVGNDFETVSSSINLGQPFGFGPPLTKVARDIETLVRALAASDPSLAEARNGSDSRRSKPSVPGDVASLLRRLHPFRKG